ncbi:hypothetical protein G5T42_13870 [Microbacterium sp. 4R-513]|uniref:hypothetical protein n=1 Tax=Microbacterium sp. 4R-513 TaxID=2567934 RepID=UPI0013E15FE5|nr:hypothetical protein [Microbacterium sp. 4R-513]QIG40427.1 hypothetical protein G5T42_13870 [Microbacterium sp. 4R-513]
MHTITMGRPAVAGATVGWDHLEETVDHLADIVDHLMGAPEFLCSLRFAEAEALAEVLDAGHHTGTAARLMHRWALTEPDWDDDAEQSAALREWLALSVTPGGR